MQQNPPNPSDPSHVDDPVAASGEMAPPPQRSRWIVRLALIISLILVVPWCALVAMRVSGIDAVPIAASAAAGGALLAVLLGVIGFVTTRRGRPGRGTACVAVLLGLFGAFLQYSVGEVIHRRASAESVAIRAARILKTPSTQADAAARTWRDELSSERFRLNVSADEMASWLESVITVHGQMQTGKLDRATVRFKNQVWTVPFSTQFVNGTRRVEVDVGFDNKEARVDDIRVDESSPLR